MSPRSISSLRIGLFVVFLTSAVLISSAADTPTKAPARGKNESSEKGPTPIAPRSNILTNDVWKGVPTTPLAAAELDQLIAKELQKESVSPAPRTTDEQFLRRVYLDLAGR